MSSNRSTQRTRVTRPDLKAMPEQATPQEEPEDFFSGYDTSGYAEAVDVPEEVDAVQQVASEGPALPAYAEGATVRDANGKFLAVCGKPYQSAAQRFALAKQMAEGLNKGE